MPIKPENINRYPDNWSEISKDAIQRANNRCQVCGLENGELIKRLGGNNYIRLDESDLLKIELTKITDNCTTRAAMKKLKFTKVILQTAHLDGNPENCEDENLMAMCQKCHTDYDKTHKKHLS